MAEALLNIKNLTVNIDTKQILNGVDLEIKPGETHVLMGPNGAGKSTLGYTVMGKPNYEAVSGRILFDGEDITDKSAEKRARDGIFLSFQNPLEVPGISLESFIRSSLREREKKSVKLSAFRRKLAEMMELLQMDPSYAERDLNLGFSGGERKKSEILQMLMLEPKLAILDETDSGLDVDAARTQSMGVEEYQKRRDGSLLIITHSTRILEYLKVDYTHVMVRGEIVRTGDASLIEEINSRGFEEFLEDVKREAV